MADSLRRMKTPRVSIMLLLATIALTACATVEQQQTTTMGGIQGATAGAIIGSRNGNTLGGAVLGGVIGATTAAVLSSPQGSGTQPIFMQDTPQEKE